MEDVADSDMAEVVRGAVLHPLSFHEPHHRKSLALIYDGGCIMAPCVLR